MASTELHTSEINSWTEEDAEAFYKESEKESLVFEEFPLAAIAQSVNSLTKFGRPETD
jgi:hypothetical protein